MGNGSSASAPSNTIQVNAGTTNGVTRFQSQSENFSRASAPQQLEYGHGNTSQPNSFAPQPHYQKNYHQQPSYDVNTELDDNIETALAPSWGGQQNNTRTKGSKKSSSNGTRNDNASHEARNSTTSDEIVFEVYHNLQDGRDYTLIYTDGARFYLDSWTTGEWQPFPDEWLEYGYIESNNRDGTSHGAVSMTDVQLDDAGMHRVNGEHDDRMGFLDHPTKGNLSTYFMEEHRNIHCVFDPASGAWLKLPLSWELNCPEIKAMIKTVQEAIPTWNDEHEILALLRQCNYDCDEVVATFFTLLHDDYSWRSPVGNSDRRAHDSITQFDQEEKNAEIKRLKKKVSQLESLLDSKDTIIEDSLEVERRYKRHLEKSDTTIRELQVKVTCLERDLRMATKNLDEQKPLTPKPVTPKPQRSQVDPRTVKTVMASIESLSKETNYLRDLFSVEKIHLQGAIKKAIAAVNSLELRSTSSGNEIEELRTLYHKESLHRKLLYNKLQELRGNIRVFCRCRYDSDVDVAVKFPSDQEIQARAQTGVKTFMFDRVFSPATTQEQVFEDTLPLITSCVDGYNVCIMAYGQTGSGKTFTMMGPHHNPGVNIKSILELLRICNDRPNVDYTLSLSMLEVYNETLIDLLAEFGSGGGSDQQLTIQVKGKQVVVQHLTKIQVNSAAAIKTIMAKGDSNRSVGSTKMNTTSSRSHLMVILQIQGVNQVSHAITQGTLTLVDLAGSERISKTEATGQRLVEAAAINKSLSALGQVFTALRTNAMHVPYRNSKLTQLLQSSLGGDGKACLFVNISPAESNLSETLSTLQFGSAAKQVQLGKAAQNITKLQK